MATSIPAHSLSETIAALGRLLGRAPVDRLIVAGDLVESPRPCRRTATDLGRLREWLRTRGVDLVAIQGNHDPPRRPRAPDSIEVAGWTIAHGHRKVGAERTMTGHDHPILRVGRTVARCVLAGPKAIVLPALTDNAAGLNVAQSPARWRGRGLRCWAGTGSRLLDFGPVDDLALRVAAG